MHHESNIREALAKAHDEKRLISCRFPGGGDFCIALERHMVDDSIREWLKMTPKERGAAMLSIRRQIKRGVKRFKQGRATGKETNALASDIALWLGHELLFSDGQRHLIKGPRREDLVNAPSLPPPATDKA